MEEREIEITTDFIPLDSFLKFSGLCASGGEAKNLVSEGNVLVNGKVVFQRGRKLFRGDTVEVPGARLRISGPEKAPEDTAHGG